jgi:aminopeptidase-like protein
LELCIAAIDEAQHDVRYVNTNPKCEPQLGRRGLYDPIGAEGMSSVQLAQLWMLSYSDGEHSLADIRELSGLDSTTLARAAERLEAAGLLKPSAVENDAIHESPEALDPSRRRR